MFSQVSVCPQSASWILVQCSALLRRGRYASYRNVLLFDNIFVENCMKMKEIGPRGGGTSLSLIRQCIAFIISQNKLNQWRIQDFP